MLYVLSLPFLSILIIACKTVATSRMSPITAPDLLPKQIAIYPVPEIPFICAVESRGFRFACPFWPVFLLIVGAQLYYFEGGLQTWHTPENTGFYEVS